MSALPELTSYMRELGAVLYIPFCTGRLTKEDAYGGSAEFVGNVRLNKGPNGYGLYAKNGGAARVVDSGTRPELLTNETTVIVAGTDLQSPNQAQFAQFVNKWDVGGNHFNLRVGPSYLLLGTAAFSSYSDRFDSVRTLVSTFADGVGPSFYIGTHNGSLRFFGQSATAASVVPNDADVYIGNLWNYSATTSVLKSLIDVVAIIPSILNIRQLSDIHAMIDRISINTAEPQITKARPLVVQAPLLWLNGHTGQGLAYDESDNAINFDKSNGVEMDPDTPSGQRGFNAHGGTREDAHLTVTDTRLDDIEPWTLAFWVKRRGPGENNAGRIIEKLNGRLSVWIDNNGAVFLYRSWSVTAGQWYASGVSVLDRDVHLVIRYQGTVGIGPVIWANGASATVSTTTASAGVINSDAGIASILDRPAFSYELDGTVDDLQIHDRYLTDVEAKETYLRSALRTKDRGFEHTYPEHPVVSAGEVGPFGIESGQWEWNSENELVCGAVGHVARRTQWLYGAQYFEFNKSNTNGSISVILCGDLPTVYTDTSQNCILLQMSAVERIGLYRIANGATAAVIGSTAVDYFATGINYSLLAVHAPDGTYNLYIRGGAYTTWTLALSGSDTVYGPGRWASIENHIAVGCTISRFAEFPYFYGRPNDHPLLAD